MRLVSLLLSSQSFHARILDEQPHLLDGDVVLLFQPLGLHQRRKLKGDVLVRESASIPTRFGYDADRAGFRDPLQGTRAPNSSEQCCVTSGPPLDIGPNSFRVTRSSVAPLTVRDGGKSDRKTNRFRLEQWHTLNATRRTIGPT